MLSRKVSGSTIRRGLLSARPAPAPRWPARFAGFTLIELMITIVILAILLSVAIPLYQHQIRESRRTDARTALLDLAGREERYYATNNIYSNSATALGYSAWGSAIGSGYYSINSPTLSNNGASFSLTAVPIAGKGQDKDTDCTSFTVTSTGLQTSANSGGADSSSICWGQ